MGSKAVRELIYRHAETNGETTAILSETAMMAAWRRRLGSQFVCVWAVCMSPGASS
jgi:hypothetical protein